MRITKGNFAGARVTGMVHMAGVSAQFDAEFESYEDALDALRRAEAVES